MAQSPAAIDETVPPESNNYPLGADSQAQHAVAGTTFSFTLSDSRIFPGTTRTISVYVPAAYRADKPACVYVGFDGLNFHAATVFDNLIAAQAMPVTIGIGIAPGTVPSSIPPQNPRFDRSFEFDSRSDLLARFVLNEVLPAVERHTTPDGRVIRLSADPNDRAIGGGSTGAIAAFTVAWERPDAFRRVFSAIGTYVGMRGGEQYYVLVRKTEPKPLRIFMQDGVHDEWPGGPEMGDWWMSNQTMNRALSFAGYDVRHTWGAGSHDSSQAEALFPEAMRWLWRDYPAPVQAAAPGNPVLQKILQPGESWQSAARDCGEVTGLAANTSGQVYYPVRGVTGAAPLADDGKPAACEQGKPSTALAFGPEGELYQTRPQGGLRVGSPGTGTTRIVAPSLMVRQLTVLNHDDIYAAADGRTGLTDLWLIQKGKEKVRVETGLKAASALALSPDGLWLFVAQGPSRAGLSYRVRPDGTLDARVPFYDFYVPAWSDSVAAKAIAMDRGGLAYVATAMGVQVFDRNGRVAAILPMPGNLPATAICFGGSDFQTLYVASGGYIYKRKMHSAGAPAWAGPAMLPPWGSG